MASSFDDFQTQVNAFGILEGSTEIKAYQVTADNTNVLYEASWCFVGVFTKITGKGDSLLNAFADYITQKSQFESSKEGLWNI